MSERSERALIKTSILAMKCTKIATDIMATSTTKLTQPIRLTRLHSFCSRPSLKMRLASLGADSDDEMLILMPDYFVILATSRWRVAWDLLCFLCTAWCTLLVPWRLYDVARIHDSVFTNELGTGIYIDWITDFFFLLNIYLNAKVFAFTDINEQGKKMHITDRNQIWEEYYKTGRLLGDILTVIPYDLLGFFLGSWNFLRVPKMLMAVRFPFLVTRLKNHVEDSGRFHISMDAVVTIKLSIATFVLCTGCRASGQLSINQMISRLH